MEQMACWQCTTLTWVGFRVSSHGEWSDGSPWWGQMVRGQDPALRLRVVCHNHFVQLLFSSLGFWFFLCINVFTLTFSTCNPKEFELSLKEPLPITCFLAVMKQNRDLPGSCELWLLISCLWKIHSFYKNTFWKKLGWSCKKKISFINGHSSNKCPVVFTAIWASFNYVGLKHFDEICQTGSSAPQAKLLLMITLANHYCWPPCTVQLYNCITKYINT